MIVVVGLSHKSAPIEVRERVALDNEACAALLQQLTAQPAIAEAFAVSTCNRMEIVLAPRPGEGMLERAGEQARALLAARVPEITPHLYQHTGGQALRHVFRVAASLDSLVLGEAQILGQVKAAVELARSTGTVGGVLNRVVIHAVRAAKRVRSETTLGVGQVSVPSVAIDLAEQIFGDLRGKKAALVGSGEMGEAVAKLLAQAGGSLVVVGRNAARVEQLAAALGGSGRTLEQLDDTLAEVDVVVATTSAPGFIISRSSVIGAMKKRRGRSLFFVDLAVPRDVDPSVSEVDNAFLYNVDDLSNIAAQGALQRKREAQAAEALVERELQQFERLSSAEQVTPVVVALRRTFRGVLEAELERSQKGKLRHLTPEDLDALQTLFDAALNKLLHTPTHRLRQLASEEPPAPELDTYVEVLSELFAIGDESTGLVPRRSYAPSSPSNPPPSNPQAAARPPAAPAEDTQQTEQTSGSYSASADASEAHRRSMR